jgi:cytoskeleton protein RodZ
MFEIGSSLREARLRQGLDYPELEQVTKIRAKYLRALEDEQFDVLPAQTYVKGFLRSYAEYLGLDGQLYVDEYNSRYVGGEEETPLRTRRPTASRTAPRFQSRVVVLTLLGIALVTALVIVAWKRGSAHKQTIPGLGLSTNSTARTKPAAAVQTHRKRHRTTVARLVLTAALDASWVQVHRGSATGPLVYQGTLEKGQRQTFTGGRLSLIIGRPEVVTATLNGKAVHIPTGGPKNIVVTARGIRLASGA